MKIRKGFVSNSSSTSFVIYGVEITDDLYNGISESDVELFDTFVDELIDIKQQMTEKYKEDEKFPTLLNRLNEEIEELKNIKHDRDFEGLGEILQEDGIDDIAYRYGLKYYSVMGESYFIGQSPYNADDNLTFGEWKEEVKNKIKKLFPKIDDNEFGWIEECWRDG